jgi:electron transport complex protein RnfC
MQTDFDEIIDKLKSDQLWDFPGGIFPAQRKGLSNQEAIIQLPLPKKLYVTVKQHIGVEGHLVVEEGDKVLKGQALTKSMNPFAVPVHAPTSGTVSRIGSHESAHPSGLAELTVEIEPDNEESWTRLKPLQDYQHQSKMNVLAAICDAGISGMGGAGFPTHIKASPKKNVEFLIINGVECEPYITSDDRLMREHAWQIRQGIDVLCHLLSPKQILIAIEDNKPEAIAAMRVACNENTKYLVCPIPTKYPAGGEKQLIQVLTNREVPKQGLPIDVGVIMHNVGTCFAVADAVFSGKPLIERVVTLSGEAIARPANIWALIGTPIEHLLNYAEYQASKQNRPQVIMGGPMMGFTVKTNQVPIVKISNCILVPADHEISNDNSEQACIRCSACADACPASLLPQQLFWHSKAKEFDKAQDYNLFDCIECGACAYVCPSEIPLVHYYRIAKADIRIQEDEKQKADKARERFESRAARLIEDQKVRDEKHRKAAEARKDAMAAKGSDAKDKIAAALARAKAKKEAAKAPSAENDVNSNVPTEESAINQTASSSNDRVAAAIARAKAKRAAQQNIEQETRDNSSTAQDDSHDAQQKVEESPTKPAPSREITLETKVQPEPETKSVSESEMKTVSKRQVKTITEAETKTALEANSSKIAEKKPVKRRKPRAKQEATKVSSEDTEKQAKVAAAVAKAKAKRAAKAAALKQEAPPPMLNESQALKDGEKPEEDNNDKLLDAKKKRIAAAVAKAKAKKAAASKASADPAISTDKNNDKT